MAAAKEQGSTSMEDLATQMQRSQADGVLLTYSGTFTQDLIESLGARLAALISEPKKVHKVLTIFNEISQNIMQHGGKLTEPPKDRDRFATIVVGTVDGRYTLTMKNKVNEAQKKWLSSHLSQLSGLDADELKRKYNIQKRNKGANDNSPTQAGLGFYWIMKRGIAPIKFSFEKNNDDGSWTFFLRVII